MRSIKGPGIFLAQFLRDAEPYNNLENIGKWVADLGYKGVQIPTWDSRVFDLDKAAQSKAYCDDLKASLAAIGLEITELAAHLQGQVLAIHPAYETAFAPFYPNDLDDTARVEWAIAQLIKSVKASANMRLKAVPVLSGALAWHMMYPWPQRPTGLISTAFKELYRRWKPVLDAARDEGITIAYELHPGSDIYDGATFEMFLDVSDEHAAACLNYDPSHFLLQQLDYCEFIRLYGKRITAFHVKDAEFNASGRVGVYGGYQSWSDRAGRFRSLGDGQIDFTRIFTLLTEAGFDGWAVLEWECCVKSPEQGAAEGAPFIARHIIEATDVAFDDFAGGESDDELNKKILGLA
ncbi:MAG: sugar phosphate isomerase/epimerase family protein [Planctomycetota bacterium]|jgi:sugar phosphate isomerase/epimerase